MKLNTKSPWDTQQINDFLQSATIPMRLSFLDKNQEPMICSLWFTFHDNALWSASHKNAYLISRLKNNSKVSFEVSTNDYPYKGVRGKATVELSRLNAKNVLAELITKYLAQGNSSLANWLMSRVDDEYVLKITPITINAWDFSNRMEK